MAMFFLDEQEQAHVYSCLLVGNGEFLKVNKSLAKLNRTDDAIDEELQRNAKLRKIFNPRAEEEARAKEDPRQLTIDDEASSSGETGGSTKARLTTPPAPTDVELRDSLLGIGLAVSLADIRAFTAEQREAVVTWLGQVVAANTIGGSIAEEPDVIIETAISVERLQELLDEAPITIQVNGEECFEVINTETGSVLDTLVDHTDAQLRAARIYLRSIRDADMSDADVDEWALTGPWFTHEVVEGKHVIRAGAETEICADAADAKARAARYNRTIAGNEWRDAKPVRVTDDAVQAIKAAEEHENFED